jgi:hypothetical protein
MMTEYCALIEGPTEYCALIEGPEWGDTKFYGNWLLAAAKANELWTEVLKNPRFSERVGLLTAFAIPDFSIGATVLLSRLEQNLASFVVSLNEETVPEKFAMMIKMGFFTLTGQRYCIPNASLARCRSRKPKYGKVAYVTWTRPAARPIECCYSIYTQTRHQPWPLEIRYSVVWRATVGWTQRRSYQR